MMTIPSPGDIAMQHTRTTRILCACLAAAVSAFAAVYAAPSAVAEMQSVAQAIQGKASVLVANTRGDNILRYD
jgi:hypothetical protein